MARPGFLPTRDTDLDDFATNFSTLISATPTAYGLVALDATDFAALRADFTNKLAIATNPTTRTKVAIIAKNAARDALVAAARALARRINADPDTTDTQRGELGLTIRDGTPTPFPPPASKPVLIVESTGSLTHGLRIADEFTPASRARAQGSAGCELYAYRAAPAAPAPASADDYAYCGLQTRYRGTLAHPAGTGGQTAYVIARWINARGEPGPWSSPVTATIAA